MPPDQGFEQVTDLYTDLYFILILYILTSENIKLLLSCFYYIFFKHFLRITFEFVYVQIVLCNEIVYHLDDSVTCKGFLCLQAVLDLDQRWIVALLMFGITSSLYRF